MDSNILIEAETEVISFTKRILIHILRTQYDVEDNIILLSKAITILDSFKKMRIDGRIKIEFFYGGYVGNFSSFFRKNTIYIYSDRLEIILYNSCEESGQDIIEESYLWPISLQDLKVIGFDNFITDLYNWDTHAKLILNEGVLKINDESTPYDSVSLGEKIIDLEKRYLNLLKNFHNLMDELDDDLPI